MNTWTILIFGSTGDLSRRKIIPALYALLRKGAPIGLIVGTGRETTASVDTILERARPFINGYDDALWQQLRSLLCYQPLDFGNSEDFIALKNFIDQEQHARGLAPAPCLVYLAIPADFFCVATDYLVQSKIVIPHDPQYRIVYEKPFGWDLQSAQHINDCIKQALSEFQVYRIDHYLVKEFVGTILLMRYANTLFQAIWNNKSIATVHILFHESVGLEGRGTFFDRYGALKDVLQNHMLQLLALITMDAPANLGSEAIRDKKAEILRSVRVTGGLLGQYKGYLNEPGVSKDSTTETYAAIQLFIDHPNWEGVPFYLETGKHLDRKTTEIRIVLKPITHCPWSAQGTCNSNLLVIRITPQEGFSLQVNTKKPGTVNDITTVSLNFTYASVFGPISSEAYEIVLRDVMAGQQSATVRSDEIEYQWDILEKIQALHLPLYSYEKGSQGPIQAITFFKKGEV